MADISQCLLGAHIQLQLVAVQEFVIILISAEEELILKHYGIYLQLWEQPATFQNNRETARTRYARNNLRLLTQLL